MTAVVSNFTEMEAIHEVLEEKKHFFLELYQYLQYKSKITERLYPAISRGVMVEFLTDFGVVQEPQTLALLDEILFESL